MLRADKERIVAELAERLRVTHTLLVTDYRGLTTKEIDALRGRLLEHGARFRVVKNSLTRRAAEAAGVEGVLAFLDGPTAIAFLDADGDPVAVARALRETARQTRLLAVRGGLLDGRPLSVEEVETLATLPTADVLRSQVLGAVTAPLVTVVALLAAPLRDLVGLLEARAEQLGGEQDGSAAAAQAGSGARAGGEEAFPDERTKADEETKEG